MLACHLRLKENEQLNHTDSFASLINQTLTRTPNLTINLRCVTYVLR